LSVNQPPKPAAFTEKAASKQHRLAVEVYIKKPAKYEPASNFVIYKKNRFKGIWDTGASTTAINEDVVEKLRLPVVGFDIINTANGQAATTIHAVDLILPNNALILAMPVVMAKLHKDIQILIGMDVINRGDFSITNYKDKTQVSFRMPSVAHIDYEKNPPYGITKNSLCPCGSGKKYKRCCMKKLNINEKAEN
jgi:hypothetical protein